MAAGAGGPGAAGAGAACGDGVGLIGERYEWLDEDTNFRWWIGICEPGRLCENPACQRPLHPTSSAAYCSTACALADA